jgi:hypothetical protein
VGLSTAGGRSVDPCATLVGLWRLTNGVSAAFRWAAIGRIRAPSSGGNTLPTGAPGTAGASANALADAPADALAGTTATADATARQAPPRSPTSERIAC